MRIWTGPARDARQAAPVFMHMRAGNDIEGGEIPAPPSTSDSQTSKSALDLLYSGHPDSRRRRHGVPCPETVTP